MAAFSDIPLDKAGIISTVLEGVLYGFSLLMFAITLWVLFYHRSTKDINRPMVVVAILLFTFSTMHLGVDIHRIILGLVDNRNHQGGPAMWFADTSQFTFVFKNTIYLFQTVLGDGVVIYRCYMVWQSVYVIIFPLIMLTGAAVAGAGSVWACSQADPSRGVNFIAQTEPWITAFCSSTLSTNLICTFLLTFRIQQINSRVRCNGGSTLVPVVLIIIDAGLLYSASLLSGLVCFVAHSNGTWVVLDMIMPITSIAFYMVIIRVGVANVTPSRQGCSSGFGDALGQTQNRDYVLQPLEVHISQLTSQQDKIDQRSDAPRSKHAEEV